MTAIPQAMPFDSYSFGQQAVYPQATIQTFNATATANPTTFQNTSNCQPAVVNPTTTYLQTPTYSPQAINETTTASNLMLSNAVVTVSTPTPTANTISPQPMNAPNPVASQQPGQMFPQTITPVENNGMNFFPTLPIDNSIKNGQIITQATTSVTPATYTAIPQNNDQRYPSPPMGAVDINKNQCQQVAIAAPIQTTTFTTTTNTNPMGMVNNTPANGYIPMNQGTLTQVPTNAPMNMNGAAPAQATYPQQQANGFQQYYNQSFTQIQGKGQQQTIISSTTNIASNYPTQAKLGQGNILVNAPITLKSSTRAYNKNNEPISLELALKRQKNTEAARRSRMRKVLKMETLENHVKRLEADNKNLSIRLAMLDSNRMEWETKEKKLLDRIRALEEELNEARKGHFKSENVSSEVKKEEKNKE